MQSPGVRRGRAPSPCPATAPQPCPAEALGRGGDKGVPSLLSPPAAQVPWGPRAPSPIYIYKYNPRNKPETTRDQRCVLPGGTGQSSRSLRSRRAAPLPSHGASPRASPLPAQPSFPSVHPSSVRPSLLPAWSPGARLQCGTSQGQAIVLPVPCCRVGDAAPVSLFSPAVTRTTPGLGTSGWDGSVDMASSCALSVELETPSGVFPLSSQSPAGWDTPG